MLTRHVKKRIRQNAFRRERWKNAYCRGEDKAVIAMLHERSGGRLTTSGLRLIAVVSSHFPHQKPPEQDPSPLHWGTGEFKPETVVPLKLNNGRTAELVVAPSYFHFDARVFYLCTEARREYARQHAGNESLKDIAFD